MAIVVTAAERLITTIHRYYIYELAAFSAEQVAYIDQVKSLYYLTISVYDEVVQRESLIQERQQPSTAANNWQRSLPIQKTHL